VNIDAPKDLVFLSIGGRAKVFLDPLLREKGHKVVELLRGPTQFVRRFEVSESYDLEVFVGRRRVYRGRILRAAASNGAKARYEAPHPRCEACPAVHHGIAQAKQG
jgi:hypothetical protein